MRIIKNVAFLIALFFIVEPNLAQSSSVNKTNKNVVYLGWKGTVDRSLSDNLSLQSKILDYEAQQWEEWRAYSYFLPTLDYQGVSVNSLELPVMMLPGEIIGSPGTHIPIKMGTKFNIQHSLTLNWAIFNGGARWINTRLQKNLRKSLTEELRGKEAETVLNALKAYFGSILADSIYKAVEFSMQAAKSNFEQVQIFHSVGSATSLDLQRAKTQYLSTLPSLEAAKSNVLLSKQNLKFALSIPIADSIVVHDSLVALSFLDKFSGLELEELKLIAATNRSDLKSMEYNLNASKNAEHLSLTAFSPILAVSAGVTHQGQNEHFKDAREDMFRSKSISLVLQWNIFEGGRRYIDYEKASVRTKQTEIALKQIKDLSVLEVEQSYFAYIEAKKNLDGQKEALESATEGLRLANLTYSEGMATQLDVLNAQLLYSSTVAQYLQGLYNYNISQLTLLKSIGLLNTIWEKE